jgi:hypothetical protein
MVRKKPVGSTEPEEHSVPWLPLVVAFRAETSIRETFAQWWEPQSCTVLDHLLRGICDRSASAGVDEALGGEKMRHGWKPRPGKTLRLEILLDYPFREPVKRSVQIGSKRFGEVFGLAHDIYREVYALDDAHWSQHGHEQAPVVGKRKLPGGSTVNLLNRQGGAFVWGHDITDLHFESLCFEPSAEALAYLKARRAFFKKKQPKDAKPPRFNVRHSIGTVSFFIGS